MSGVSGMTALLVYIFSMKTIEEIESNQPVIMHEMNELNNMQNR